ncbi:Nuclear pore protein NUP49 [Cladobotryum mycophilum]|uniref:Nuclear pore protein NUP49 n=1 Tax=Cladobotryum mycophilum TaxID=491253 RepID=A0ABR0SZ03_9HYPO
MSLVRSASGPVGLTINTGAANTLGAASTQSPAAGGFFGSTNASTPQPASSTGTMATTGGLFGSKPAGGSLFGGATTTTPTAGGGGLFGASTAAPASTGTTGGGLFGGGNTANAGAGTTGGLFGAGTTTQQNQNTAGGGIFGNKPAATGTTGGLFGNTAPNNQQQQTGGGLFGNTATTAQQPQQQQQQQQQMGGGLFGNTAQQPQQQQQQPQQQQSGGGLFGNTTTNTSNTAGGGFFGQTQPQAQQKPAGSFFAVQPAQSTNQVGAVQINYENLRPRSRFDDLAPPVQSEIDLIDKGIQRVIKMRDEIGQFMPQHEKDIAQLGRDVQFVESKFKTVQDALNRDIQTVKVLQDMTKKNITDGQLSFKAADNLKLPTHYHQTGLFASTAAPADSNPSDASSAHASAQDLITYFNRICDDVEKYKKRLDEYRSQIERDMPGVENGLYEQIRTLRDGSNAPVQDQLNQVLLALRETSSAIFAQAGVIADTREKLSRLQAGYLDSGLYGMGMTS